MKKIISLFLSFCFLFGIISQNAPFKTVSAETGSEVSTASNDVDFEYLVQDILTGYEIVMESIEADSKGIEFIGYKMVSSNDILSVDDEDDTLDKILEITLEYDASGNLGTLTGYNGYHDYQETIQIVPEIIEDTKFDGTVCVTNEYGESVTVDVFEIDDSEDIESEDTEEASIEPRFFGVMICGVALWKIVVGAAVAMVAIHAAAYPEFYVRGIQSLFDATIAAGSIFFEKMTYNMVKVKEEIFSIIEQIRNKNDKNIYYIAIPITKHNAHLYNDVKSGDMLLSEYPVNYATAKRALRAYYSIYTFDQNEAYRVVKFAWTKGYAKLEPCDKGFEKGFYEHYHAYYREGNKLIKREKLVEGISEPVTVHGYFGYPW